MARAVRADREGGVRPLADVGARGERFGLGVVSAREAAGLGRDLAAVLGVLEPGGLVAVHHYPDPAWPAVRTVVDEHARRLNWARVEQRDYLGVFET